MNGTFKGRLALICAYLKEHWFAALLAGIFVVVLGVWFWTRGWGVSEPPPPPSEEVQTTFGKLSPISPKTVSVTNPRAVSYNRSANLKVEATTARLYPYIDRWLTESNMNAIAGELKFTTPPQRKDPLLIWNQGAKHLSANLKEGYFEYSESFAGEIEEWGNITLPERDKIETIMENRMENLLPASLTDQIVLKDIRYHSIVGNHIVSVVDSSNAKIAEGIFKRELGDYDVYLDNPKSGVASLQISPIRKTVRIRFELKSLNMIQRAVYPLKTVDEAWQALEAGKGFLVYLYDIRGKKELSDFSGYDLQSVNISKVSLAYYEASQFDAYLQPIFVFTGTGTVKGGYPVEVVYYVQAVEDEWVE